VCCSALFKALHKAEQATTEETQRLFLWPSHSIHHDLEIIGIQILDLANPLWTTRFSGNRIVLVLVKSLDSPTAFGIDPLK